jgi:hypothetical protein
LVAGGLAARFAGSWAGRTAIGAAALGPGSELAELTKTESNVVILPGQKKRFRSAEYESVKNGVLVIGGATVQNSENIAKAIAPGLEELGPVMAVDWSHTGFNMKSLANDIQRVQKKYGMKNLSLYFHSMGDIEAGMLMPLIANNSPEIHVPMMIFDDSIVNLSDLKVSRNSFLQAVDLAAKEPSGQALGALEEGAEIFSRQKMFYIIIIHLTLELRHLDLLVHSYLPLRTAPNL